MRKSSLAITIGSVFIIGGGLLVNLNSNKTYNQQRNDLKAEIRTINKKTNNYKEKTVLKTIEKDAPDLEGSIDQFKDKTSKALKVAFSNINTNDKYDKASKEISSGLGVTLGNKVLSQVKPQNTQMGLQAMSEKLNGIDYSFGEYTDYNKLVPFKIIVTAISPEYNPTAGSGTGYKKGLFKRSYLKNMYVGDYNTQTKEIVMTHSYTQLTVK